MRLLAAVVLVWSGVFARGQTDVCVSCEMVIRGEMMMFASPYFKHRLPVCEDCAKDAKYCFTCRLPAQKGLDLKDGRVLCKRDAKTAVLSGEDAKALFE